jgi:hypothetical protein
MRRANNAAAGAVRTNETFASADYEVTVVLRRIGTDGGAVFTVLGRLVDNNNNYILSYFEGDGLLRIRSQVGGTRTALTGGTATFSLGTLNTAQDYTIKLRMSGTTIEGYVDGVKRVDGIDSTYTAANQAGMSTEGTASGYTGTTGFNLDSIQVDTLGGGGSATAAISSGYHNRGLR